MKKIFRDHLVDTLEITAGIVLLTLGFYFFLFPVGLVIGGMMGIAVITEYLIGLPPSVFMLSANSVLLILAYFILGKKFFLKTIYGSLLSPVLLFILERTIDQNIILSQMSENIYLLAAIGSGVTLGLGLGLAFRHGATTGGIDVLQHILHKWLKIPFSHIMYVTDGLIVLFGIFIFDAERGIYAIMSIFISGYLIDRVSIKGRAVRTAFIISYKPEEIKQAIYQKVKRGVTEVDVVGGYSKAHKTMLICSVNRRQHYLLKEIVEGIDKDSFMFSAHTKEVIGLGFSTRKEVM